MKSVNWENTEKAIDFALRRAGCEGHSPSINELLEDAKKIYDFLGGESYHFIEVVEAEELK